MPKTEKVDPTIQNLKDVLLSERPTIPVKNFVEKYLPLLARHFSGERVDLSPWLEICERPTRVVAAVDSVGNVDFIIPPILLPTETKPSAGGKFSAMEVMTRASDLYKLLPAKGDVFLNENLHHFALEPSKIEEFRSDWTAIFTRYGYEIAESKSSEVAGNDAAAIEAEVDYEFEEL